MYIQYESPPRLVPSSLALNKLSSSASSSSSASTPPLPSSCVFVLSKVRDTPHRLAFRGAENVLLFCPPRPCRAPSHQITLLPTWEISARTHTHTHTHTQPFYKSSLGDFHRPSLSVCTCVWTAIHLSVDMHACMYVHVREHILYGKRTRSANVSLPTAIHLSVHMHACMYVHV